MVTIRTVARDRKLLSSQVEALLEQGRVKEAEERTREFQTLVGRLNWTGAKHLRASLENELSSLEWKAARTLVSGRDRDSDRKELLVAAIDRVTLADRARKDGNETLCRNFVSEARAILDKVASCKEKEAVVAFLSGMGAWSGDGQDGTGKSAKAVTV